MIQKNLPLVIEIDKQKFEVFQNSITGLDIQQQEGDLFVMNDEGTTFQFRVIEFDLVKGNCIVSVNGQIKSVQITREIEVMIEKMGLNASHAKKQSVITAPMPGLVTGIRITPQQHVEKGMPLIILEAMKMENVISAPHDAVVKNIRVNLGQAVEKGFTMIEFEG